MQKFWTSAKLSIMNRQPGMSWADLGKMDISALLHVLSISEKNEAERMKQKERKRKRQNGQNKEQTHAGPQWQKKQAN